jgi:hypothetical protein
LETILSFFSNTDTLKAWKFKKRIRMGTGNMNARFRYMLSLSIRDISLAISQNEMANIFPAGSSWSEINEIIENEA